MLPYGAHYFEKLIRTGSISQVIPSEIWYEERKDFSKDAVGKKRTAHKNNGVELLPGPAKFSGEILGGCLDSLYDLFDNTRYPDTVTLCQRYHLFPGPEARKEKLLLLETSEEQPSPERYEKMLRSLKSIGIFRVISGILHGKPMDEHYYEDYKVNFSVAVHICLQFFLDKITPPNLEALLARQFSPIRRGRKYSRRLTPKENVR